MLSKSVPRSPYDHYQAPVAQLDLFDSVRTQILEEARALPKDKLIQVLFWTLRYVPPSSLEGLRNVLVAIINPKKVKV